MLDERHLTGRAWLRVIVLLGCLWLSGHDRTFPRAWMPSGDRNTDPVSSELPVGYLTFATMTPTASPPLPPRRHYPPWPITTAARRPKRARLPLPCPRMQTPPGLAGGRPRARRARRSPACPRVAAACGGR